MNVEKDFHGELFFTKFNLFDRIHWKKKDFSKMDLFFVDADFAEEFFFLFCWNVY